MENGDCPHGEDEDRTQCTVNRNCSNMLRCRNSITCIHFSHLCDTYYECPLRDEEYLCSMKDTECPTNCTCLTLTIRCKNVNGLIALSKDFSFKMLFVLECSRKFTYKINSADYVLFNSYVKF